MSALYGDRCIISLLYYAGLRISELCSLNVSSVRPEHFKSPEKAAVISVL